MLCEFRRRDLTYPPLLLILHISIPHPSNTSLISGFDRYQMIIPPIMTEPIISLTQGIKKPNIKPIIAIIIAAILAHLFKVHKPYPIRRSTNPMMKRIWPINSIYA
jgi:hypothetical protein